MNKTSLIPNVFVLFFLYMFCSILCFSIEDINHVKLNDIIYFGNDYWKCFSYMIVSSLIIFAFQALSKHRIENDKPNKFSSFLVFAILLAVFIHISNISYQYFIGKSDSYAFYVILVNIFGLVSYFGWLSLEKSELRFKKTKIYFLTLFTGLGTCLVLGGVISNFNMPLGVIKLLNNDAEILKEVEKISYSADPEKEAIQSKDIKYQKISNSEFALVWNFKTNFQNLKQTKRLKEMFSYPNMFPKKGYNFGENKKIYNFTKENKK